MQLKSPRALGHKYRQVTHLAHLEINHWHVVTHLVTNALRRTESQVLMAQIYGERYKKLFWNNLEKRHFL